jgi:predicted TIM-barrel fold metal-dependent hydrolase
MIPACLPPRDVSRPKVPPPPDARDTHAHVFGPGTSTEGFQSLLRAVGDGWCWAKLSGAHRISHNAPDYPDARPFHEALVRANPERLVWGGDWPHPRVEGEMPDAGHLFELFQMWTPDRATQQRILVTNPATLYGFPN